MVAVGSTFCSSCGAAMVPGAPAPAVTPSVVGAPAVATPGFSPRGEPLAAFGDRFLATLIDYGISFGIYVGGFVLAGVFGAMKVAALSVLTIVATLGGALGFVIWNVVQEGNTGQTIGKRQVGLRLVKMADGQLVGPGLAIGRYLLHIVDSSVCYLGYLFPLWDPMRQTFADKIVGTIVLKER
jgi:uncharacterized RDD family membrane protein YckC